MSICSFQGTEQGKYFYPDGLKRAFPLLREVMAFFTLVGLSGPFLFSERLWLQTQMGLSGLEPPTSRLSGVRSNRLSYKPISIWQPPTFPCRLQHSIIGRLRVNHRVRYGYGCFP